MIKKWYHANMIDSQGRNFEIDFISAELEGTLGLFNSCMKAIGNEYGDAYAKTCAVKNIEYISDYFQSEVDKEFAIKMFELMEEYLEDQYDNINFLESDYRAGYDQALEDVHEFVSDLVCEDVSLQDMYDEYSRC